MSAPEGDSFVSDGTHSGHASRILWGDQGPAYAQGWKDALLAFAANLDSVGMAEAAALAREAASANGAAL